MRNIYIKKLDSVSSFSFEKGLFIIFNYKKKIACLIFFIDLENDKKKMLLIIFFLFKVTKNRK